MANWLINQKRCSSTCYLGRYFAFSFFIFLVLFSYHAASATVPDLSKLKFEALNNHPLLSVAKDETGDSWIKGELPKELIRTFAVLQIPTIHIPDFEMYAYKNGLLTPIQKNTNLNNRVIKNRYLTYYFRTDSTLYYLNIKKHPVSRLDIIVNETGQFSQMESTSLIQNGLYYGLSLMVIIFNIVLYFVFYDRRFVIYALFQLSLLSIFFYQDGMYYYFSDGRWDFPNFLVWNIAACAILSGIFTYYFLGLKQQIPYFKKMALWLIGFTIACVALFTLTEIQVFRNLASVFFYLFPSICVYHAVRMFKKDVYARFLILFYGLMLLVGVAYTLQKYLDSPFLSFFDMNVFRLTSILEIIGVSFALIFKVRALQKENEQYRADLRKHLTLLEEHAISSKQDFEASEPPPNNVNTSSILIRSFTDDIADQYELTERETEVLACIWNGDSNQDIADQLYISINTVKFHVSRLYVKLDVKNRSEVRSMKGKVARSLPL